MRGLHRAPGGAVVYSINSEYLSVFSFSWRCDSLGAVSLKTWLAVFVSGRAHTRWGQIFFCCLVQLLGDPTLVLHHPFAGEPGPWGLLPPRSLVGELPWFSAVYHQLLRYVSFSVFFDALSSLRSCSFFFSLLVQWAIPGLATYSLTIPHPRIRIFLV